MAGSDAPPDLSRAHRSSTATAPRTTRHTPSSLTPCHAHCRPASPALPTPRQVAAEAARVLGTPGPVPSATLTEQFNEALCAVAFDPANIARSQTAVSTPAHTGTVPYCFVQGTSISMLAPSSLFNHAVADRPAQRTSALCNTLRHFTGLTHTQQTISVPQPCPAHTNAHAVFTIHAARPLLLLLPPPPVTAPGALPGSAAAAA